MSWRIGVGLLLAAALCVPASGTRHAQRSLRSHKRAQQRLRARGEDSASGDSVEDLVVKSFGGESDAPQPQPQQLLLRRRQWQPRHRLPLTPLQPQPGLLQLNHLQPSSPLPQLPPQ